MQLCNQVPFALHADKVSIQEQRFAQSAAFAKDRLRH